MGLGSGSGSGSASGSGSGSGFGLGSGFALELWVLRLLGLTHELLCRRQVLAEVAAGLRGEVIYAVARENGGAVAALRDEVRVVEC